MRKRPRTIARTIRLLSACPDGWLNDLADGRIYINSDHITEVLPREPLNVLKSDGSTLLLFRPRAIPLKICEAAWPGLRKAGNHYSEHREFYTAPIGYFKEAKDPDCRRTAFTQHELEPYGKCLPFVRAVNDVFRWELPERYLIQRQETVKIPKWSIGRTAFTTVTVNLWTEEKSARTYVHTDKGDLREGFGVISILRKGRYRGGELIFPRYGIAVDMKTTDVLLADVHEFHGNAPIETIKPEWERIATIHYFRTAMLNCAE